MDESAIRGLWEEVAAEPESEEARAALRAALQLLAWQSSDPGQARRWRTLAQAQGWLWEHRRWPAAARRPDTGRPAYRWAHESAAGPAGHAAVPARVYGLIRPAGWEADGFATFAEAEEALALALAEAGEIGP